ncbi:hypothetical protein PVT71_27730 (plasmid) [Salipiger sp. H15]|uniref:Uncharacterized protein n=1 Tax=Alloyangia sp. H15 TaxID=3029062 RepID=A0AAU8AT60_9RHOB
MSATAMPGGQIILKMPDQHAASHAFGLPCETMIGWHEGGQGCSDIEHVPTHDERTAGQAAARRRLRDRRAGLGRDLSLGPPVGAQGGADLIEMCVRNWVEIAKQKGLLGFL